MPMRHTLVDCVSLLIGLLLAIPGSVGAAKAQSLFERSLAIQQKLPPDPVLLVSTLNTLGVVTKAQGELARRTEPGRAAG